MTFDHPGYNLIFVQKAPCKDKSDHLFTLIYKFYSPVIKYLYILHADYHTGDVFATKFYAKPYRHSDYKYSAITNKGDVGNILITCAKKVVPLLLKDYPNASFGFSASRTVDTKSKKVEHLVNNQRFKTYRYIVSAKFGTQTFAHYAYEKISACLLENKRCGNFDVKEREIIKILTATYVNVPDIN